MVKKRRGPRFVSAGRATPRPLVDHKPVPLEVERLADDGRGVARHAGRTVLLPGVLAGERVLAKLTRRHKRYDDAEVLSIERANPDRAEPPCAYYQTCGGCSLQHLQPDAQLTEKQQRLQALLSPWAESLVWAEPLTSQPWHYRSRTRLILQDGGAGFRARASHQRIAIQDCGVLAEPLAELLPSLQQCVAELPRLKGELKLACDESGQVAADLSLQRGGERARQRLERWAAEQGVIGLQSDDAELKLDMAGTELAFTPRDFTQANLAVNRAMVHQALDWLAPSRGESIADFFCGLGNFSLPLAAAGARVTGFELDPAMVIRAAANADRAGLKIEFRQADLMQNLAPVALSGFSAALLDPPRLGAEYLSRYLADSPLQRLLYVSCEPQTLARDLNLLAAGWRPVRAGLVDMFPQTAHIESMVLLERI